MNDELAGGYLRFVAMTRRAATEQTPDVLAEERFLCGCRAWCGMAPRFLFWL